MDPRAGQNYAEALRRAEEPGGIRPKLAPDGFDPKIMGMKALKTGLFVAAGVFLSDQAGLTQYLLHFVPPQYALIGPVVIGAALKAIENWIRNRNV